MQGKYSCPQESRPKLHIESLQLNENKMINGVLCIPTFKFNLLSVHKLTKELNYPVFFSPHFVYLKVKGISEVKDGLYVMN